MQKTIRSFVKRQRTLGLAKQKIYDLMWPKYGLTIATPPVDPQTIFDRNKHLTLEIGFGNGETLFALAKQHPEQDFIGIEVHKPGIASLFALLKNEPLENIRIYNEDAVEVLKQQIPDATLDRILILFPDPWPKKRHHKRRLIQPSFVVTLQQKLKPNGILHIVTDWEDYAIHITNILGSNNSFSPLPHVATRSVITKFEQRGKKQGHSIFELLYTK